MAADHPSIQINQVGTASAHLQGRLTFDVEVIQLRNNLAQSLSTLTLTDPWSDEVYTQYYTYLEQRDAPNKSLKCATPPMNSVEFKVKLQTYAYDLFQQLQLSEDILSHACPEIHICGSTYGASSLRSIDSLLWESLEQVSLRDNRSHTSKPLGCIIVRSSHTEAPLILTKRTSPNVVKVLLLIVRRDEKDAPASLVLWELQRIQYDLRQNPSLNDRLDIQIVRPGTYCALQQQLQEKGDGFFDILHFDTHGGIQNRVKPYIQFKSSNKATGFRPADQLAKLLRQHQVRAVSLNSCDSANAFYGSSANLADVFRREEIPNVLGMSGIMSTTAVARWSSKFFRSLILAEKPFSEAAALSRMDLYNEPLRRAQGDQTDDMVVYDWPIPTAYTDGQRLQLHSESHAQACGCELQLRHPQRVSKAFARKPSFASGYSRLWLNEKGRLYRDGRLDDDEQSLVYDSNTQDFEQVVIEARNKVVYLYGDDDANLAEYSTYLVRLWLDTQFITHAFIIHCAHFAANWARQMADHVRHFLLHDSIHHLHKSQRAPRDEGPPRMAVVLHDADALFPKNGADGEKKLVHAQARFHAMLRQLFQSSSANGAGGDGFRAPYVIVQGTGGIPWLRSQEGLLRDAVPFARETPGDICSLLTGSTYSSGG